MFSFFVDLVSSQKHSTRQKSLELHWLPINIQRRNETKKNWGKNTWGCSIATINWIIGMDLTAFVIYHARLYDGACVEAVN